MRDGDGWRLLKQKSLLMYVRLEVWGPGWVECVLPTSLRSISCRSHIPPLQHHPDP